MNPQPLMNHWTEQNNALHKTFEFSTFQEAIEWMVKASVHIAALNHHPKWTNMYNTVTVELSTHDEGNIVTEKDRQLAQRLDSI
jgi:4a-hydroxytetrahydrobiopterin dehydratase